MAIDIHKLFSRTDLPHYLMEHRVPAEDREWEEDMKGTTIRLPGRITRVISLLMDDPQSPYYKQWKTKSDYIRDILVYGTIKVMEGFSKTRSEASEWALSEDVLRGIASKKSKMASARDITSQLMKSILDSFVSGYEKEAIDQWEGFIDQLDQGPKDQRKIYGEVMVKNYDFEKLEVLIKKSQIIEDFVQEFL